MKDQGTGKHPHKSSSHDSHSSSGRQQESGRSNQSEQSSLKQREYRGPDGQEHHHTRTYEQQHGGKKR